MKNLKQRFDIERNDLINKIRDSIKYFETVTGCFVKGCDIDIVTHHAFTTIDKAVITNSKIATSMDEKQYKKE